MHGCALLANLKLQVAIILYFVNIISGNLNNFNLAI